MKTWLITLPTRRQLLETHALSRGTCTACFPRQHLPAVHALRRRHRAPVTITLEGPDGEAELTFTAHLWNTPAPAPDRAAEIASAILEGIPTRLVSALYGIHRTQARRTVKRFA